MQRKDVEQQKIFVDGEEELTTVVDHLRRCQSQMVVLVIPQHAVLLQSVVNLKLLSQEAVRLRKSLTIMTNDEDGLVLAKRAGIATKQYFVQEQSYAKPEQTQPMKNEYAAVNSYADMSARDELLAHARPKYERTIGSPVTLTQQRALVQSPVYPQQTTQSQMERIPNGRRGRVYNDADHYDIEMNSQNRMPKMAMQEKKYSYGNMPQRQSDVSSVQRSEYGQYTGRSQVAAYHRNTGMSSGKVGASDMPMKRAQSLYDEREMTAQGRRSGYATRQEHDRYDVSLEEPGSHMEENTLRHTPQRPRTKRYNEQKTPKMQQSVYGTQDDELYQYEQSLQNAHISSRQEHHNTTPRSATTTYDYQKRNGYVKQLQSTNDSLYKRSFQKSVERKQPREHGISPRTKVLVKGFIGGGIILFFLVAMIAVLPKSQILISPKHVAIDDNIDLTFKVDQSVADTDRRILPARIIERDITYTKSFKATGVGDVGAQKAQGTIVIYNAFDGNPQTLVATTRFLSENGTLFRLVKTTIVPGMKNGEPGKVEALVIADKEGAESNIGPGRFSVPGFDSSPKKEKIYAVSEKAMMGGGAGGSGVALVTQDDIARAQKDMESGVNRYISDQLSSLVRPDNEILLSEAIKYETVRSEASVSENTMKEDFMYEIVTHARAIVFMQDDVRAIMEDVFAEKLSGYGVSDPEIKLAYQGIVPNFDDRTIKMSVHGSTVITAQVNVASFKEDIRGKKHDDLLSVIEEKYEKSIDKIIIQSVIPAVPAFIAGRISPIDVMTDIRIEQEQ